MDELAKRFADLAEKYGPQVIDTARQAARMEAYSTLVGSLEWLGVSIMLLFAARFLWRRAKATESYNDEPLYVISGLAFLACGVTFFAGIWNIIDPWTWTAISHPDVWIAKRTIGL